MKRKLGDPLATILATGFGAGLTPIAPGTAGSALALPLAWLFYQDLGSAGVALIALIMTLIGFWSCNRVERLWGEHDSPRIVIDEIAGQLVTFVPLVCSWPHLIVGFGLFRLFDTLKPWPAGWIDREVEGGIGVMLDDLVAGLYACGVTLLLVHGKVIMSVLTLGGG